MTKEIESAAYTQLLDTMLLEFNSKIEAMTRPPITASGLDSLDEYIHALNAFYYRSFKEHYFPQFINLMNSEISMLLNLRHQEDRLEQDIMTSMQRYVKLYNQVKTIRNLLFKSRHEINKKLIDATRYEDKSNTDFLLAVKQLKDNLQLFRHLTLDQLQLTEDKALIRSLQQIPEHAALVQLLLKMDFGHQKDLKDANTLLAHFIVLTRLLKENSQEFWSQSDNNKNLQTSLRLNIDEYTKKASPAWQRFYNKYIKNQLSVYMQLISPTARPLAKNSFILTQDLKEWLDAWAVLLERSIYYRTANNVMIQHLDTVMSLPADYARLLHNWVNECSEETDRLYDDFARASEPDFAYFHQQATLIIEKYREKLSTSDWRKSSSDSSPLPFWQSRVMLELSNLAYQMNFFEEKHSYARHVRDQYLEVVNLLDGYLNLLATIRSDLERLMAPRNIARAWKDIHIKIERIPVETGKEFPEEYQFLLPENIERSSDTQLPRNTVLYEEGDLFVIKVADLTAFEVPVVILAR